VAITKKEFVYIPIINLSIWTSGFLFLDRKNRHRAMASIEKIAHRVREEELSVFMAPEGTRTDTGEILPFKKGPFRIAAMNGVPVLPIVVQGAFELWPKTKFFPQPGTIQLHILPEIDTKDWSPNDLEGPMKMVRDQMKEEYALMKKKAS
jgi:1-acyl-sn-glycerol-3-phosphate acyltransferase